MQQYDYQPSHEPIIVVHTVNSWTEAIVVRGLLMSAGIESPELGHSGPSPMPDLAPILQGIDIYALQSQAARAREVIAEFLEGTQEGVDPQDFDG